MSALYTFEAMLFFSPQKKKEKKKGNLIESSLWSVKASIVGLTSVQTERNKQKNKAERNNKTQPQ